MNFEGPYKKRGEEVESELQRNALSQEEIANEKARLKARLEKLEQNESETIDKEEELLSEQITTRLATLEHDRMVENGEEELGEFSLKNFHENIKPFLFKEFGEKGRAVMAEKPKEEEVELAKLNLIKESRILKQSEYLATLTGINRPFNKRELVGQVFQMREQVEDSLENIDVTVIDPLSETWWEEFEKNHPDKDLEESRRKFGPQTQPKYKTLDVVTEAIKQNPDKTPAGLDFYVKILKLAQSGPKGLKEAEEILNIAKGVKWANFTCPATAIRSPGGEGGFLSIDIENNSQDSKGNWKSRRHLVGGVNGIGGDGYTEYWNPSSEKLVFLTLKKD